MRICLGFALALTWLPGSVWASDCSTWATTIGPNVPTPFVQKILTDLETRLAPGSVLELPQFAESRKQLRDVWWEFLDILQKGSPYDRTNRAIFKYVDVMSRLLRSADPSIQGTYHRDFAKGVLDELLAGGDGTSIFFANEAVDDEYFWEIRPNAAYHLWLIDFPAFAKNASTYKGGPLVPREQATKYLDGLDLDGEEILKHDAGHSFLMQRQDRWLFATLGQSREELVAEWTATKNKIRDSYRQVKDHNLAVAIRFLISELVHERGYQFFLPILYQQVQSRKWIDIIAFKKKNNYWGAETIKDAEFARMDEALAWLKSLVRDLTLQANEEKIAALKADEDWVLLKRWRPVETYAGVPKAVEFRSAKDIRVTFDVPGEGSKTTSLYEVALVLVNPSSLEQAPEFLNFDQFRDAISPVEEYKLKRLLTLIREKGTAKFTLTRQPDSIAGRITQRDGNNIRFTQESGRRFDLNLAEVSFQPLPAEPVAPSDKYVNLDPHARFVDERVLHDAYEHYEDSLNVKAPPFVTIQTPNGAFELAMVNTEDIRVATAVSSLLTRSLEDAKYTNGGYLPPSIVQRVQTELVSPYGVTHLWGKMGRRFVLSRKAGDGMREIVASALVGESRDNVFFFTSRFNNLKHSQLANTLDFNLSLDGDPEHRWLDKFSFPEISRYKPEGFHHFANFVVEREGVRGQGLARLLLEEITKNYSREYLETTGAPITHSQRLLCGKGFWQIGDPPWLARMSSLGFTRRLGAETFHVDVPWDPLIPTLDQNGQKIDHVAYNRSFGMPQLYEKGCDLTDLTGDPLLERISTVIDLALSGNAKLQYFQLLFPFSRMIERGARPEKK
jgi:hypothetical protein